VTGCPESRPWAITAPGRLWKIDWPPLITYPHASELMQPGKGALDHQARHAGVTAMSGAVLADLRNDPSLPQDTSIALAVVL
jgi:hypothetical protein